MAVARVCWASRRSGVDMPPACRQDTLTSSHPDASPHRPSRAPGFLLPRPAGIRPSLARHRLPPMTAIPDDVALTHHNADEVPALLDELCDAYADAYRDAPGADSTVKPSALRNRTISSLNHQAPISPL